MVRIPFLNPQNAKISLRILLAAGAISAGLVVAVALLFVRTVEADALLPRPAVTLPPPVPGEMPTPAALAPRKTTDLFHGVASWYGGVFNGRKTASGGRFDMYAMTACHPTLPFGSLVRVRNLTNNQTVDVRITDRGFLYAGRVIDLSFAAAKRISMVDRGVTPVEIEILTVGSNRNHK